jgi:hypothetical protein
MIYLFGIYALVAAGVFTLAGVVYLGLLMISMVLPLMQRPSHAQPNRAH